MPFVEVNPTKGSNITCSLKRLARKESPFLSIVHVAFSGNYRVGSAGTPDAHYISHTVKMVDDIWRPSGMILDLTDLHYQWGDGMGVVLEPPSDDPFAIVVSPKCEPAISSLCCGANTSKSILDHHDVFDALEPALAWLKQEVIKQWNLLATEYPKMSSLKEIPDVLDFG